MKCQTKRLHISVPVQNPEHYHINKNLNEDQLENNLKGVLLTAKHLLQQTSHAALYCTGGFDIVGLPDVLYA